MERPPHRIVNSLLIVLVLAFGVGAHALSFAAAYAAFWRPLPLPGVDGLVMMGENHGRRYSQPLHYSRFLEWRSSVTLFAHLSANRYAEVYVETPDTSEQVPVEYVSAGLFRALRVSVLGREFLPGDDQPGSDPAAMVGHELWTRLFGADRAMLGRPIIINGRSLTLVGIVPAGFRLWRRADVYLPVGAVEGGVSCGACGNLYVLGRLKPGVTRHDAQREMNAVEARLTGPGSPYSVAVRSYREFVTARPRPLILAALVATGLILLLACVHVSNLVRANVTRHLPTLGLQAGRSPSGARIVSELVATSGAAGVLGFAFCAAGCRLFTFELVDSIWLPIGGIRADWVVLLYSLGVALLAGAAATLVAVVAAKRGRQAVGLRASGMQPGPLARPLLFTNTLLILQLAIAVALAFSAGVRARNFYSVARADQGSEASHVLALRVRRLPPGSPAEEQDTVARLLRELKELPGVLSTASARLVPGDAPPEVRATLVGESGQSHFDATVHHTSPGYLQTLGLSLLRGRWFADTEDQRSTTVVINETAAARFWKTSNPVGSRLSFQSRSDAPLPPLSYTVIGLVRDTRPPALAAEAMPELYLPEVGFGALAVRTTGEPSLIAPMVRQRIAAVDRTLAVYGVTPLARLEQKRRARPRQALSVMLGLALVWMIFTSLGFYAATAIAVTERTRPAASPATPPGPRRRWTRLAARGTFRPLLATAAIGVSAGVAIAMLLLGAAATDLSVLAGAATLVTVAVAVATSTALHVESHGVRASAPRP